jgi:hypothetical protein
MVLLREGGITQPVSPELNPKENLWDEIREKIFKNYAMYDPPASGRWGENVLDPKPRQGESRLDQSLLVNRIAGGRH